MRRERNDYPLVGRGRPSLRFDIVVFNHRKLDSFLSGFWRIKGLDSSRDRVTVVSASPSAEEHRLVDAFEREHGVAVRYLERENRGFAELGRAEYFTGAVGGLEENLSHAYIFQMQDHYLDTESPHSRWFAPEPRVRGDAVPAGTTFDLDRMEGLASRLDLDGFVCDRRDPALYRIMGRSYAAPTGGNFIIRADALGGRAIQRACRRLIRTCDDTYRWAIYAEAMWGLMLFERGSRVYDLKRGRLLDYQQPEFFYRPPQAGFRRLRLLYRLPRPLRAAVVGARNGAGAVGRKVRGAQ